MVCNVTEVDVKLVSNVMEVKFKLVGNVMEDEVKLISKWRLRLNWLVNIWLGLIRLQRNGGWG